MEKTFKMLAKDAKKRIRSGFWEASRDDLREYVDKARQSGMNASKVERYYTDKLNVTVKGGKDAEGEEFYARVKAMLLSEGEVSDAIGRLTDREYYATLSFEERGRYTLDLSERYLRALERFKKECEYEIKK